MNNLITGLKICIVSGVLEISGSFRKDDNHKEVLISALKRYPYWLKGHLKLAQIFLSDQQGRDESEVSPLQRAFASILAAKVLTKKTLVAWLRQNFSPKFFAQIHSSLNAQIDYLEGVCLLRGQQAGQAISRLDRAATYFNNATDQKRPCSGIKFNKAMVFEELAAAKLMLGDASGAYHQLGQIQSEDRSATATALFEELDRRQAG